MGNYYKIAFFFFVHFNNGKSHRHPMNCNWISCCWILDMLWTVNSKMALFIIKRLKIKLHWPIFHSLKTTCSFMFPMLMIPFRKMFERWCLCYSNEHYDDFWFFFLLPWHPIILPHSNLKIPTPSNIMNWWD